jgi:uncharacterized protein with PIN domain
VCEDDNKNTDMTASLYLRRKYILSSSYNHCIMLSSQDYAQNTASYILKHISTSRNLRAQQSTCAQCKSTITILLRTFPKCPRPDTSYVPEA